MEKKETKLRVYFLIGAIIGVFLFVCVYGVRVLDFTYDGWLLTGKDLQQHYLGWKYFRQAPWSFPIGMHDYFTNPDRISVLYTDSIPLFAIVCKAISGILPETFQYFGLFGMCCYLLNGGISSLILAKFNKSKWFCGLGSVFFVLATPVLQRMFGVLSENSRHTSLAAQFLILGALCVWVYKEYFKSYKRDVLVWALMAALCVLIQMYFIFMVGGILCGYLLEQLLVSRDWKRLIIDLLGFAGSFLFFFAIVGGFTSLLSSGGSGYGFFSANLNTFLNPYRYSTLFPKMNMIDLQYEGFAYLGFGMILLCVFAGGILLLKSLKKMKQRAFWSTFKKKVYKNRATVISVAVVVFVFAILAFSNLVYVGSHIFVEVHWPKVIDDLLAIIRSSGRFIWCVMYIIMFAALFILSKYCKKPLRMIVVVLCVCIQLVDLYKPIARLQETYYPVSQEDESLVSSDFWKTQLGNYDKIVYFPSDGYEATQMLQIGSKASQFNMKMSNFYLSRYMTKKSVRQRDKVTEQLFKTGNLEENTVYILDYSKAHKYMETVNLYMVDQKIIALKNPVLGLEPYVDFVVGDNNPVFEMDMSFAGIGRSFLHRGWHQQTYGNKGAWTTSQSVVRIYSQKAGVAKITIEYKGGKKRGTTTVKMNGRRIGKIKNLSSGTVTFEAKLKECKNIKKARYINWLFLESDDVKEATKAGESPGRGIQVRKITVSQD